MLTGPVGDTLGASLETEGEPRSCGQLWPESSSTAVDPQGLEVPEILVTRMTRMSTGEYVIGALFSRRVTLDSHI